MAGGVQLPNKMDPRLLKAAEEAIPSSPNLTIYQGIANLTGPMQHYQSAKP